MMRNSRSSSSHISDKMISLRKINSILLIIVVLLLALHGLLNTLLFFQLIDYSPIFRITGRWLFYPLALHVIISLYLYGSKKLKRLRNYRNLTKDTTQQIVTGICIILFAAFHIMLHSTYEENLAYFLKCIIADNLLFISVALHLRVSVPRWMVSFGLLKGKTKYQKAKRVINIVIAVILIFIFIAQATFYGGYL